MNQQIRELRTIAVEYTNSLKPIGLTEWELVCNQKFAELIVANHQEVSQSLNTDPINRRPSINSNFLKLCAINGSRRRNTWHDQDYQNLLDINGNEIPHVSKVKKGAKE